MLGQTDLGQFPQGLIHGFDGIGDAVYFGQGRLLCGL
jgi:hypothetical protein